MKLAIPRERQEGEARVAASPETVKKLVGLGLDVTVETGAGEHASFADALYADAGAKIAASEAEALKDADLVFKVRAPLDEEIGLMKRGAMLAAILNPYDDKARIRKYADAGINAFAMEFMPRITRAQSMDVLSSQSNLAGYKAVINAAAAFTRAMPMMMTAAGTVAPARTFIMGVGVAGLQAIATAKRLGCIVSATDVRSATKEQVESLGGTFVMVESEESGDAAGGYAKEMSEDYKRAQAALVAGHIKKQDIVLTTALLPGPPAPVLVTEGIVRAMQHRSQAWRDDHRRSQRRRSARRRCLGALCQEPAQLHHPADRQGNEVAQDQLGRRNHHRHRADAGRTGDPPGIPRRRQLRWKRP